MQNTPAAAANNVTARGIQYGATQRRCQRCLCLAVFGDGTCRQQKRKTQYTKPKCRKAASTRAESVGAVLTNMNQNMNMANLKNTANIKTHRQNAVKTDAIAMGAQRPNFATKSNAIIADGQVVMLNKWSSILTLSNASDIQMAEWQCSLETGVQTIALDVESFAQTQKIVNRTARTILYRFQTTKTNVITILI